MEKKSGLKTVDADGMTIQLRRPEVAAILAWLIPGAGHFYQKRFGKAALYSACVLTLYIIGMVIGGGKVVYTSWRPEDRRWHYLCQVGVGIPALPAAVQGWYTRTGKPPLWNGFMARPIDLFKLDDWHAETSAGFDLGSLYTMIAGILNILIVFDAYSGPLALPGNDERGKKKDDEPGSTAEGAE